MKTVSRQRRYQLKRIAAGLCPQCGGKPNLYALLCDTCRDTAREKQRSILGCKPWREGGPGRKPKGEKT